VEDAQTGRVFFVINTHNYRLPYYEVTGLEAMRRFGGEVELSGIVRAKLAGKPKEEAVPVERMSFLYRADRTITIDGALDDWKGIPGACASFPGERGKTNYATARWAYDRENIYGAFSVGDETPARNKCTDISTLWDGDCLELYLSPNAEGHTGWKKGDVIVHVAATTDASKPAVGLLDRATEKWSVPDGARKAVRVWPDGKGYDLECVIPYQALGYPPFSAGQLLRLDWDICYGDKEGKQFAFKLGFTDGGAVLIYDPNRWAPARCVEKEGEEELLYQATISGENARSLAGWEKNPYQSRIQLENVGDKNNAYLKLGGDDKNLYFYFTVADPTPALVTPSANWIHAGDYLEMRIGRKVINIPASPAFTVPYFLEGGQAQEIQGGRSIILADSDKKGYRAMVSIPRNALGTPDNTVEFNWRVGWSDVSGGSFFAGQSWLPWEKGKGRLRLTK